MKTLILLAVVALLIFLVTHQLRTLRKPRNGTGKSEKTLRCQRCGIFVPAHEAFMANGRAYCSAEHRDADDKH